MTIKEICKKYGIKNYTINGDTIDVNGDVDLKYSELKKLPLKFGTVTGDFSCSYNKLKSLEGAPKKVTGHFSCRKNNLTSLEGAPEEVGEYFDCSYNKLTSLKHAPRKVNVNFYCYNNKITSKLRFVIIDAKGFITDFGTFKIPKDKHERIKWIFENDD